MTIFRHLCLSATALVVAFGTLLAAPAPAQAATQLRGIELRSAEGTGARLTLALSGPAQRRVFTLTHPARVVIDLPGTRLAPGVAMPAGRGVVRSVRLGARPGQTLRLVLELATAVPVRSDLVRAGGQRRLVVALGRSAHVVAGGGLRSGVPTTPDEADTAPEPARAVAAPLHPAHAPANTGRDIIVAVDAGHGGQDPGASGLHGTHEKDVVLAIARALARRIDAEPGMKAYLTRDSDHFVVLRDRIDRARAAHADLFVSVHADSIANRDVAGSSVYVLSAHGASSEAARWLAERENAADLKGGVKLGDKGGQLASVLMDLSQTASIGSSMEAAQRVLGQLDHVGEIRKSQVQQAGFLVLKSPDIPSMLVETAYISNPGEEAHLRTAAHQEAVAGAIFTGLREYFRRNPPDGTLFAQQRSRGGGPILAADTRPPGP
jgi:N-acetylmuramoyl-L-alanine amidase